MSTLDQKGHVMSPKILLWNFRVVLTISSVHQWRQRVHIISSMNMNLVLCLYYKLFYWLWLLYWTKICIAFDVSSRVSCRLFSSSVNIFLLSSDKHKLSYSTQLSIKHYLIFAYDLLLIQAIQLKVYKMSEIIRKVEW